MEEVSAAKNTIMKNAAPINEPAGIELKTFGRVTNISPGPALRAEASPPEKANTAGITIRPARNATLVSNISI